MEKTNSYGLLKDGEGAPSMAGSVFGAVTSCCISDLEFLILSQTRIS